MEVTGFPAASTTSRISPEVEGLADKRYVTVFPPVHVCPFSEAVNVDSFPSTAIVISISASSERVCGKSKNVSSCEVSAMSASTYLPPSGVDNSIFGLTVKEELPERFPHSPVSRLSSPLSIAPEIVILFTVHGTISVPVANFIAVRA